MNIRCTKIRFGLRWAIYLVTLTLIALIPVSMWIVPNVSFALVGQDQERGHKYLDTNLVNTRFAIEYYDSYTGGCFRGEPFDPGLHAEWFSNAMYPPMLDPWWSKPKRSQGGGSNGGFRYFEIPLIYPTAFMLAWSLWIWHRNRSKPGHCSTCGYNLAELESPICPECGTTHA